MIDVFILTLLIIYIAVAIIVVRRIKKRALKYIIAAIFIAPVLPSIYQIVSFKITCLSLESENIYASVNNVDSVIFLGGVNTKWVHYLAKTGGYSVVEYPQKHGKKITYEQNYQSKYGVRRRESETSDSLYQIEKVVTRLEGGITETNFVASEVQSGKILGKKTFLSLRSSGLSRYLNWKLRNNINGGDYMCPNVSSLGEMFDFFTKKILISKDA